MGMRFSKRLTLFPGFRLNLGKKGVSLTLGPRGSSIGIGSQGIFSNLSIPGTGISFRTKLFNTRKSLSEPIFPEIDIKKVLEQEAKKLNINENYELFITDATGNKLSDSEFRKYKKNNRNEILSFLKNYADNFNQELTLCINQYHLTPTPNDNLFNVPDFNVQEPTPPVYLEKNAIAKWFKLGKKVDMANEKLKRNYDYQKTQYNILWKSYLNDKKNFLEKLYAAQTGDVEAMEKTLENLLNEIQWEKETIISFELNNVGNQLSVDVDLPEIEDIPNKTASVTERGLKLNIINKPSKDTRVDYRQCIFSILFRIAGFIFCALPTVQKINLSGYTQRYDKSTGHQNDEYIVSVIINREQWININFDSLENVDPFNALGKYDLKCEIGKNGDFCKIIPF
ncbi:MAG: DUF4236 domain-containing protein [Legionella sp.]|jgi:hypothetical protein